MPTTTFPGRFDSIEKISDFVQEVSEAAGLSASEAYAVQLAVDEACTNIIEHAYGGEGVGAIECTCEPTGEGLRIVLRDKGRPFNPDAVPEPKIGSPLEEVNSRGLGVFFMRKMMDEVVFAFERGGNVLTMVKRKSS